MQDIVRNGFNRSQIIIIGMLKFFWIFRRVNTLYPIQSDIRIENNEGIKNMSFGYKPKELNHSKR